jgi:hypothetical protein
MVPVRRYNLKQTIHAFQRVALRLASFREGNRRTLIGEYGKRSRLAAMVVTFGSLTPYR